MVIFKEGSSSGNKIHRLNLYGKTLPHSSEIFPCIPILFAFISSKTKTRVETRAFTLSLKTKLTTVISTADGIWSRKISRSIYWTTRRQWNTATNPYFPSEESISSQLKIQVTHTFLNMVLALVYWGILLYNETWFKVQWFYWSVQKWFNISLTPCLFGHRNEVLLSAFFHENMVQTFRKQIQRWALLDPLLQNCYSTEWDTNLFRKSQEWTRAALHTHSIGM